MSHSRHRFSSLFKSRSHESSGKHASDSVTTENHASDNSASGDNSTFLDVLKPTTAIPQTLDASERARQNSINAVSPATPNLWQVAFQSDEISFDERCILNAAGTQTPKEHPDLLVQDIIRLTTEKCAEYEARGWHIKRSDGKKDINVRNEAKELLCSVLSFKELVDAGLKFDPTGYGASAWTVVSFGLQMVQNDKDRLDATFEASAYLANLLVRYANIEAHYRDPQITESSKLEKCIISVYVAILHYSVDVKKSQGMGVSKRILACFLSLTGQPLQALKQSVISRDQDVERWRSLIEHQYRIKESENILTKADNILSNVDKLVTDMSSIRRAVLTAEEDRILGWLSAVDYSYKRKNIANIIKDTNPQSGTWLLNSKEFLTWISLPQGVLWLHGSSGCGKSGLCTIVIEALDVTCHHDKSKIVLYWYFDVDNTATQNVDAMLRSLIRQLSAGCYSFPDAIRDLSDAHMRRGSSPGTEELMLAFQSIMAGVKKDVFLVLDALDEYPEDAKERRRKDLLMVVRDLVEAGHGNLHLLLTSRREDDICDTLEALSNQPVQIGIEQPISVDIQSLVETSMRNNPNLSNLRDDTKAKVEERLNKGEARRFRWTSLQLEELRHCHGDDAQVLKTLLIIPDDMEAAYERVLADIRETDISRAQSIFRWLAAAFRPLTLVEMANFVSIRDPTDVVRICTSTLIESFTSESDGHTLVRFAHASVKDYLQSEKLKLSKPETSRYFMSNDQAHIHVAKQCLTYLLHTTEANGHDRSDSTTPLLEYSALFWYTHVQVVKVPNDQTTALKSQAYELFKARSTPQFRTWLRVYTRTYAETFDETCNQQLYYAILHGFPEVAISLIEEGAEANARGGSHGTPLQIASHHGYDDVVCHLLDHGADIKGHERVVRELLKDRKPLAKPMSLENGEQVVQESQIAKHDATILEGKYGTPLQAASVRGDHEVVRLFLQSGTDVNVQGGFYGNALQSACALGHVKVVDLLLPKVDNIDAQGGLLGTALQAAITGEHTEIRDRLVARGARYDVVAGQLWQEAFRKACFREKTLVDTYARVLKAEQDLPKGLSATQQLLAAVIRTRSPRSTEVAFKPSRRKAKTRKNAADISKAWKESHDYRMEVASRWEASGYLYMNIIPSAVAMIEEIGSGKATHLEKLVPLIETTLSILIRAAKYEELAFESSGEFNEQLRNGLVDLYSAMLVSQARVLRVWNSPSKLILFASFKAKSFGEALDEVRELDEMCQALAAHITQVKLMSIPDQLRNMRPEMTTQVREETIAQMKLEITEQTQRLQNHFTEQIAEVRSAMTQSLQREMEDKIEAEVAKQVGIIRSEVSDMIDKRLAESLRSMALDNTLHSQQESKQQAKGERLESSTS